MRPLRAIVRVLGRLRPAPKPPSSGCAECDRLRVDLDYVQSRHPDADSDTEMTYRKWRLRAMEIAVFRHQAEAHPRLIERALWDDIHRAGHA